MLEVVEMRSNELEGNAIRENTSIIVCMYLQKISVHTVIDFCTCIIILFCSVLS